MLSIDPSQVITHAAALRTLAKELQRHPIIAVDTESNSLYAYRERVCLIQFSTPLADTLVDPLALDDLTPLAPIFADPKIEKVFHAAEYDLICLKRDFGFEFANLFDTLVAARILGRKQVGLGAILGSGVQRRAGQALPARQLGHSPAAARSPELCRAGYALPDPAAAAAG